MRRWNRERGGRGRMEKKNSHRAQLTSYSSNKMSDFFSSLALLLFASISGSNQLSDLEPIFFYALKCIECLRMKWAVLHRPRQAPNNKPMVQTSTVLIKLPQRPWRKCRVNKLVFPMTPMRSQVLIDHNPAIEITPLSLSEYLCVEKGKVLHTQKQQLCNNFDKLLLD